MDCQHCNKPFEGRKDAKYCSAKCRKAASRKSDYKVTITTVHIPTSELPEDKRRLLFLYDEACAVQDKQLVFNKISNNLASIAARILILK